MIKRILGTLLILIGALGIALSVLGIMNVWRAAEEVTLAANDGLVLLSDTLNNVERSLNVTTMTLDDAGVAIEGLYTTTLDVGQALSTTQMTMGEMAELTEENLPQSIESSLVALEALEETAGLIDGMLQGLSRFGVAEYQPAVPLDRAIAQAGEGLEPVPDSLREMGAGLQQTGANLESVQVGVSLMGDHILDIRENVTDAEDVLGSYTDTVQQLQERLKHLHQNVARPIRTVAWGATLLLAWIGLSQLALIQWGVGLWRRDSETVKD